MSNKVVNTQVYAKLRSSNRPITYTPHSANVGVKVDLSSPTIKLMLALMDQDDVSSAKEALVGVCSPAELQRMSTATALKLQSVLDSTPNVDINLQRLSECDSCKYASKGVCTRRKAKLIVDIAHCSLRRG